MRVFRVRLSVCVYPAFPADLEGVMSALIILLFDHCLSFYLAEGVPYTCICRMICSGGAYVYQVFAGS